MNFLNRLVLDWKRLDELLSFSFKKSQHKNKYDKLRVRYVSRKYLEILVSHTDSSPHMNSLPYMKNLCFVGFNQREIDDLKIAMITIGKK